jgi:hypothetical protein
MKNIGIWLDKREAKIVTLTENSEDYTTVHSDIEEYHPAGGSGTRMKGGPQDVVQDSRYLEREKHQHIAYFKSILSQISDADQIVIFGPAQTGEKLHKEMKHLSKSLYNKVTGLEKADSMTDNQIKAWVKDYFSE